MRKCLPEEVEQKFLNGDNACQHRDGVWNRIFSDQFGEQTYMRYGKSKGELVGLILSPNQVAQWVLSNNICNTVSIAMDSTVCLITVMMNIMPHLTNIKKKDNTDGS